jgi:hypothetical protein
MVVNMDAKVDKPLASAPRKSSRAKELSEALDAVLLMQESQHARITSLENPAKKSLFKVITESGSASALFLGLILTFVSLREAFVTKPEADRILRLSQFNQAVNSAAKTHQTVIQSQTTDPQQQLAMMSIATPQILNDISTARALLRGLDNSDVGIPQLIVLVSGAFTAGDLESAKSFVDRAVSKQDATAFLRSEAKRYEGKYFFLGNKPVQARQSFETALSILGDSPGVAAARAFVLSDLVPLEFVFGDCATAAADLQRLADALKLPQVYPQQRLQMASTVKGRLLQLRGQRCPPPENLDTLLGS